MASIEALHQVHRKWYGISIAPDGSIYASVYGAAVGGNPERGDIYKCYNGVGDFIALNQSTAFDRADWVGIACAPNGDVWATTEVIGGVHNGYIWQQVGGAGDFNKYTAPAQSFEWHGIAAAPNNDIYANERTAGAADAIYKKLAAGGAFTSLAQTQRAWSGMTVTQSGLGVYAAVAVGDIYKRTNGVGNFIALNQTVRNWQGMATGGNDIYAVGDGGIYKQTNETGNFELVLQTTKTLTGIAVASNDDIYVSAWLDDIYVVRAVPTSTASATGMGAGRRRRLRYIQPQDII
jgi:hypothetical protein